MKMKNILKYLAVFFVTVTMLTHCDDMNSLHDKYLKDGEIIYVAMFDSMKVYSGIERMVIHYWLSDPQVKSLEIKWDMGRKSQTFEVGVTNVDPGIIELKNLTEGQVSFELVNLSSDKVDKSVTTRFTIPIYGVQYQQALDNRIIKDYSYEGAGDTLKIYWIASLYEGSIGTELTYFTSEGVKCIDTIARPHDLEPQFNPANPDKPLPPTFKNATILLDVLDGSDLVYRNIYKPETSVDIITSNRDTLLIQPAIRVTDVTLDKEVAAVEIRKTLNLRHTIFPSDAFNKNVTWSSSRPEVARVSNGMVTGVSVGYAYIRVITDDNALMATCLVRVNANGYADLDRSQWYVAPETDMSGNPMIYSYSDAVGVPAVPSTIALVTAPPAWQKHKSPYLSHFLAGSASAAYPASGDARISPRAHIDNLSATYLGMIKGVGTDGSDQVAGFPDGGTTNWSGFHRWGGMWINTLGEKPWFIIRLSETEPQMFNYFRIRYRENGSLTITNKPLAVTFFGSNNNSCIENEALWIKINDTPIVLFNGDVTTETTSQYEVFTPLSGGETGNQLLGEECEYRYIKVQFDRWDVGGNTICISEFYLGWFDIEAK